MDRLACGRELALDAPGQSRLNCATRPIADFREPAQILATSLLDMDYVELLTVEERFQIGDKLIVAPDFPLPRGRWSDLAGDVRIITPGGDEFMALAQLTLAHFNIRDPSVAPGRRWRVILKLSDLSKEHVPVGSRVLGSAYLVDAVTQGDAI